MNILNKVTLKSLKKNKTRTVVTVIGIVLSAAMICAVTTFAASLQDYILRDSLYREGDWYGSSQNTDYATYEKIKASEEILSAVYTQNLGYAVAEGCKNEYKPYIYLLGASENAENTLPVHITSGRYPASSDEILIPEHLSSNGGVKYNIGDVLTLDLGVRISEGYALNQSNPFSMNKEGEMTVVNEELQVRETRTYTVCGFYERLPRVLENTSAPGYTAFTLADVPSDEYMYDVYFKTKSPGGVYDFIEKNSLDGAVNNDVLMCYGVTGFNSFNTVILSLAVIVICLIMFGSVSLIYNAFSISVSERTKQFGLLSSIGATKKQLRKTVFFEAVAVSIVGIPIGIIAGTAGISITIMLIGQKFIALGFNSEMRPVISLASMILAAVIALITVLISAWIPSKRATRVSAVEAIRQNLDINAKGKTVKTSKLTYKLFGLPGMLASKHYKRSSKKYRATILSLFMSIVLFVSASSFTNYLMDSASSGLSKDDYDIVFRADEDDFSDISAEDLLALLTDNKNITEGAYMQYLSLGGTADKKYFSKEYLKYAEELDAETDAQDLSVISSVIFVNDDEFKKLLSTYGLNEELYMNPDEPLAVTLDGSTFFNTETERYEKMNCLSTNEFEVLFERPKSIDGYFYYDRYENDNGDIIFQYMNNTTGEILEVAKDELCVEYTLKSGRTIYDKQFYFNNHGLVGIAMIYPQSLKSSVFPEENFNEQRISFFFKSSDHVLSCKEIEKVLEDKGFEGISVIDYAETAEQSRNLVVIIKVFSYGFIVLISLIAAANVFNTISTNISLRRREFAMLKSVGMTSHGFNRMMNYECVLYGSRALFLGLPVSIGITFLIYLSVEKGFDTSFQLPWAAIAISVLSVFAVVFSTMMYSMNKIKKDNPIDALKNENL